MRFLHLGLVVSLVLSTKASDDPNHDDSVSENPTGRATVHGHPKVAAGSGRPKPISETPLMSREADSEKHTMPPVMTEDNAMMLSDELTNAHESNEALIEEMSEQDKVISVHEFKEVLHELVKDAIDKIVLKKAGIMGKLNTAKQNLFGQDGAATGRDPQQSGRASNGIISNGIFRNGIVLGNVGGVGNVGRVVNLNPFRPLSNLNDLRTHNPFLCQCDPTVFNSLGQGNCNTATLDFNGREWCYLTRFADLGTPSDCSDATPSRELNGFFWSHAACDTKPRFFNSGTCIVEDGDSVCFSSSAPGLVEGAVGEIVTEAVDEIVTDVDKIVTDVDKIVTNVDKIVTDTVDKIVTKNSGIVGKLKIAKQNFIGHDGEITRSRFKPFSVPIH